MLGFFSWIPFLLLHNFPLLLLWFCVFLCIERLRRLFNSNHHSIDECLDFLKDALGWLCWQIFLNIVLPGNLFGSDTKSDDISSLKLFCSVDDMFLLVLLCLDLFGSCLSLQLLEEIQPAYPRLYDIVLEGCRVLKVFWQAIYLSSSSVI